MVLHFAQDLQRQWCVPRLLLLLRWAALHCTGLYMHAASEDLMALDYLTSRYIDPRWLHHPKQAMPIAMFELFDMQQLYTNLP